MNLKDIELKYSRICTLCKGVVEESITLMDFLYQKKLPRTRKCPLCYGYWRQLSASRIDWDSFDVIINE